MNNTTLAIFAIVAVMGLVGVVAVEIILLSQDSEARGCNRGVPYNASKGRCFQP